MADKNLNYTADEINELLDKIDNTELSNYATKEELNGKANLDDIPTEVSQLTNDSNFATETYVQNQIANAQFSGGTDNAVSSGYYGYKRIYSDITHSLMFENKILTTSTSASDIDIGLQAGDVSTDGINDEPAVARVRSQQFTVGDYQKIKFTCSQSNIRWAIYYFDESTQTYLSVVGTGFLGVTSLEVSDKTKTYIFRALGKDNSTAISLETVQAAFEIQAYTGEEGVGFEDSDTTLVAELPNCSNIEVKMNNPTNGFKVLRYDGNELTELTDGYSYYSYRFTGDFTSSYYVQAQLVSEETVIPNDGPLMIRCYTYHDEGEFYKDANPNLHGKTIAVFGDSIVQGRNYENDSTTMQFAVKPWSHLISEVSNTEPNNFGIGGARVYNNNWKSLYANREKVKGFDVVFVCAGTNDFGSGYAQVTFETAYKDVLTTLMENNTEVVVCTPVVRKDMTTNSIGLTLLNYCNYEKTIADSLGCKIIDLYAHTDTDEFKATLLDDSLHPNEIGQKIIADIILKEYQ